jgi:hypothetical protein
MRMAAVALVLCGGAISPAAAQDGALTGAPDGRLRSTLGPPVRSTQGHACYDTEARSRCKRGCQAMLDACQPDGPACKASHATCLSACPPMICSRSR